MGEQSKEFDHETLEGRMAAFDRWSAAKKRELGFFAGLGLSKTNIGGWCFGRHWPHLLCWSWSIYLTPYRGPTYDGPRRLRFSLAHKGWRLWLWFFELSYSRQNYDRMAGLGPRWSDAPVIHARSRGDY